MNEVVAAAKMELKNLNATPHDGHLKTGDIRKLSAKLFRCIKDKSNDYVFTICDEFLKQHNWPMGVIAFDFAYRIKNQYDKNTFGIF